MPKPYKIAVFYYTQTQQLLNILKSLMAPLEKLGCVVVYKEIEPVVSFDFPWNKKDFYQAFPECRQGIPCELKSTNFTDIIDADLVVLGYQPWFLSLSIPISSFLQEEATQAYLFGKKIVTVVGSRNMWVSSHDSIEKFFVKSNCNWVGNIVLEDRNNNLLSVLTIFRWMIDNKKEATKYLPEAGISQKDIESIAAIAPEIYSSLESNDFSTLQNRIVDKGGVRFHSNLYNTERVGHKTFGLLSKWVLKKGGYKSPNRAFRLKIFEYYLMTVIFVLSPFGSLFFTLTKPLRRASINEVKNKYVYLRN